MNSSILTMQGKPVYTIPAMDDAGFYGHAADLKAVSESPEQWEKLESRHILAHANAIPAEKLRFLQYVNPRNFGLVEAVEWPRGRPARKDYARGFPMSAPAYTAAEEDNQFFVLFKGFKVSSWRERESAATQAHSLNVHEHAFEILNLLLESRGPFGLP